METGATNPLQILNKNDFLSQVPLPVIQKMQLIDITDIDYSPWNPRQTNNSRFSEIKESIRAVGLLQPFSVAKHQQTGRWTIIQGGNTRLKVHIALWQETSDNRFYSINCIIEEFDFIKDKSISVIKQLVENEQRGELFLVDKANALYELERDFINTVNIVNANDNHLENNKIKSILKHDKNNKDNNLSDDLLSIPPTENKELSKSNPMTQQFLESLKVNGYTISEGLLSLFRFTAIILVGNLDYHLNKGLGSEPIKNIRKAYNNAKRIFKEHHIKNKQDQEQDFDDIFKKAIKSYAGKKSFNFEQFINAIANNLIMYSEFKDYGNQYNISLLVKKLLEGKKEREAQIKKQQEIEAIKSSGGDEQSQNNHHHVEEDDGILSTEPIKNNNSDNDNNNDNLDTQDPNQQQQQVNHQVNDIADDDKTETELLNLRKNIQALVKEIEKHYGISIVAYVDIGCGFLVIKKPTTSNQYQHIFVFWHLLSTSLSMELNSDFEYQTIKNLQLKIDTDLESIYKTASVDYESTLDKLETLDLGTMYKPYPHLINSFKNNLEPAIWRIFTNLEFYQYQVARLNNQGVDIWL